MDAEHLRLQREIIVLKDDLVELRNLVENLRERIEERERDQL